MDEMEKLYEEKIEQYNNLITKEFRKILNEMKSKHWYVNYIEDEDLEKMDEKERREYLKTELEEMIEFINRGVFW